MKHKSYHYSSQFTISVDQREKDGWYSSQVYDSEGDTAWYSHDHFRERDEAWEVACNALDAMTEQWLTEMGEEPEDDGAGVSEQDGNDTTTTINGQSFQ